MASPVLRACCQKKSRKCFKTRPSQPRSFKNFRVGSIDCLKITEDKSLDSRVHTSDARLIKAINATPKYRARRLHPCITTMPRHKARNPRPSITVMSRCEAQNSHPSITVTPRRRARNPRLSIIVKPRRRA